MYLQETGVTVVSQSIVPKPVLRVGQVTMFKSEVEIVGIQSTWRDIGLLKMDMDSPTQDTSPLRLESTKHSNSSGPSLWNPSSHDTLILVVYRTLGARKC